MTNAVSEFTFRRFRPDVVLVREWKLHLITEEEIHPHTAPPLWDAFQTSVSKLSDLRGHQIFSEAASRLRSARRRLKLICIHNIDFLSVVEAV